MPISYQRGDIFKNKIGLTVVLHQCNTRGSFGAGIAKQIKRLFPEVDHAQREWYVQGKQKLGEIQLVKTKSGLTIGNLYAQATYVRVPGRVNTNYEALETCLRKANQELSDTEVIGMPQIGAGLAGGDWKVIESIIERVFADRLVYVYVL